MPREEAEEEDREERGHAEEPLLRFGQGPRRGLRVGRAGRAAARPRSPLLHLAAARVHALVPRDARDEQIDLGEASMVGYTQVIFLSNSNMAHLQPAHGEIGGGAEGRKGPHTGVRPPHPVVSLLAALFDVHSRCGLAVRHVLGIQASQSVGRRLWRVI